MDRTVKLTDFRILLLVSNKSSPLTGEAHSIRHNVRRWCFSRCYRQRQCYTWAV